MGCRCRPLQSGARAAGPRGRVVGPRCARALASSRLPQPPGTTLTACATVRTPPPPLIPPLIPSHPRRSWSPLPNESTINKLPFSLLLYAIISMATWRMRFGGLLMSTVDIDRMKWVLTVCGASCWRSGFLASRTFFLLPVVPCNKEIILLLLSFSGYLSIHGTRCTLLFLFNCILPFIFPPKEHTNKEYESENIQNITT